MICSLIDGDLVAYRCAATVPEDVEKDVAFYRMDVLIQQIIEATDATQYRVFLTGKNNFRKKINPEYKANRKDTVPPVYLQDCRQYLVDNHYAVISDGCEADDLLGISQNKDTIICSLDKDLRMIPGRHYNWTKVELDSVNKQDGLRHFYKQMLAGDRSDNVFGFDGIARASVPKFIDKLIEPLNDEQDMFEVVWEKYGYDAKRFAMNANCLWIWRNEGESWGDQQELVLPEDLRHEVITMSEYMKSLNRDTSMVPTTTETQTSGIQDNGTGMEVTA